GDVFLAKYSSDGIFQWAKRICSSSTLQGSTDLKFDGNNTLITTGFFRDTLIVGSTLIDSDTLLGNSNTSNFIAAFNLTGEHQWSNRFLGTYNLSRIVTAEISQNGYYFGGYFQGTMEFDIDTITSYSPSAYDAFIYKTDFDGNGQWIRRIRGQNIENFRSLTTDEYDNVYVLGNYNSPNIYIDSTESLSLTLSGNTGGYDTFIGKYNRSGILQWFLRKGSTAKDIYNNFVIHNNVIYATGYFASQIVFNYDTLRTSSASNEDVFLAAFNEIGDPIAGVSIVGTGDYNDAGTIVNMDSDSRAYVSGYYKSPQIIIGDSIYTSTNVNKNDLFFAIYEHPPKAVITDEQMISCHGLSDGMLKVTPYFMNGPYTYKWSHDPGLTLPVATDLPAGSYTVTIIDADNDSAWITGVVTQPQPLVITDSITKPTCYNASDGAIDITVTGGTAPEGYSYAWTTRGGSGVNPTQQDQSGISAGWYIVTVKDDNTCSVKDSFEVVQPSRILFTGSIVTNVATPPGNNGSVIPAVSGGTSPYAYAWTGPGSYTSTEDTITGLGGGNYMLEITDDHSCNGDTVFLVYEEGVMIATVSSKTDVTCYGQDDGTAVISILSGEPPFNYQWSDMAPFPSSDTFNIRTGMSKGTYYITVTDNNSNTTSTSVFIDGPSAALSLLLQPTDLRCYHDNSGVIDLTVQGGTHPYDIRWNIPNEGEDLVNIPQGNYFVWVTDAHGCTENGSASVDEPDPFSVTISEDKSIYCFGDKTGELTAHPVGGIPPYTYTWDDPGNQSTQTAYELEAGFYNVIVTDLNECHATKGQELYEPAPIIVTATHSNVTCTGADDGQIAPTVSGGSVPYNYLWSNGETSMVASDLPPGNYGLRVTDYYNCKDSSLSVVITEPDEITIVSQVSDSNTITVTAEGGTPPLVYTLNGGSPQATGEFVDLPNDTYTVEVDDANNCGPVVSQEFVINIIAIEEQGYSTLQIFPNPSGGKFNLIIEASAGEIELDVLDITGVVVRNMKITSVSDKTVTEIDLSGFPKGIYLLRINNRVVKERLIIN
ncbi:MAG: C-terminal target protein, partial [Bacteroidetes bacterium]|nr:C-terminal target protein [Bacteroidota bacterium]